MENLRNEIREIAGVKIKDLYREIAQYFIIKESIWSDKVRNKLDLPIEVIINRFGLNMDNLYDPVYLPEQIELVKYIKENNFNFFKDNHFVELNYNHYEHGYQIKNIIDNLYPFSIMVKKNRLNVKETEIESLGPQKNSLGSIREQTIELGLESHIEKNIEHAIALFEVGEFLASSLISSRLIIHGINKIPSKTKESDDNFIYKGSIEEKVKFLIEKGIISKEERDKKLNIVKYVKKARDFIVHDIKRFPDASESMALLGDCLEVLKILKKIK